MNLTNALQPVDLTTSARVIAQMDPLSSGDSRVAYIDTVISEVSTQMTEMLGVHTLRAERTERYQLRQFSKTLSLDGQFVDPGVTIKIAGIPSDLSSNDPMTEDSEYFLGERAGVVTLLTEQPFSPAYFEVTYTGGYFTDTGEIGMKHEWLSNAADIQCVYRLQRQDTLGGNVTTFAGQGTQFQSQYQLLPTVRDTLRLHRRAFV